MTVGTAAICRRGHVLSVYSEYSIFGHVPEVCDECGARVLRECEACSSPIAGAVIPDGARGVRINIDADVMIAEYRRPNFCTSADCAAAFPWANRQARIWEVENRLASELEDENQRLVLREQLEALANDDLDERDAGRRWRRVADLSGQAFARVMTEVGLPLLNAALKRELGL